MSSTNNNGSVAPRGYDGGNTRKNNNNARKNNSDNNNRRGNKGNSGGAGRGRSSRSDHHHEVDMRKYEKMIDAAQENFADIRLSTGTCDECSICCKAADVFGIGSCRHAVCVECAIRIRVLGKCDQCPVCRSKIEKLCIVFASSGISSICLEFSTTGHPDEDRYNILFENKAAGERYEKYLSHVCKLCRGRDTGEERLEFPTFISLKRHMTSNHQLSYCHICTDNLNLFSRERKTYSRDQLQRHIRSGDPDDKSQKGHPKCLFCDERFFDEEGRYKHLRKDHFFCQFCESEGTAMNVFYEKHEELLAHYQKLHFVCGNDECKAMGIAFATKFDLDFHTSREHKKTMSLDFEYSDRQRAANQRGGDRDRRGAREHRPGPPPPQTGRIAMVPPQPPRPQSNRTEFVVVPSAQSSHRGPRANVRAAYVPTGEEFPTLNGIPQSSSSATTAARQMANPNDFPRLNKVNKGNGPTKKAPPEKKPVEDFPSLGPVLTPQQSANWARHTGRSEIIDADERIQSHSARMAAAAAQKQQQNERQQEQTRETASSSAAIPRPAVLVDDFPSLPTQPRRQAGPTWGNRASVITGVKVPQNFNPNQTKKQNRTKQKTKQNESSSTNTEFKETPEWVPPVEHDDWKEIPRSKPLTSKQRRELRKMQEEALVITGVVVPNNKQTEESDENVQHVAQQAEEEERRKDSLEDDDLMMAMAVEMSLGCGGAKGKGKKQPTTLSGVGAVVANKRKEIEAPSTGAPKTQTNITTNGEKTKKGKGKNKNNGKVESGTRQVLKAATTNGNQSTSKPDENTENGGGVSTWISSVFTSVVTGLLGDTRPEDQQLATLPSPTAKEQKTSAPVDMGAPPGLSAPPGLGAPTPAPTVSMAAPTASMAATPTPAPTASMAAPPGLQSPSNVVFTPPPGFEKQCVAPPTSQPVDPFSPRNSNTKALFSMAPFLTASDTMLTEKTVKDTLGRNEQGGWETVRK